MTESAEDPTHADALRFTTAIVSSYVAHNSIEESQLPNVIKSVYDSLSELNGEASSASQSNQKPAVPIRNSVTPDFIVCLEDGKKFKMMKRHLRNIYGLSPEEYRTKWGLPPDYPIVAPNYANRRSALAKKFGLGSKRRSTE